VLFMNLTIRRDVPESAPLFVRQSAALFYPSFGPPSLLPGDAFGSPVLAMPFAFVRIALDAK
jgi:hypothetical protein